MAGRRLKRIENWPRHLVAVIDGAIGKRFRWGKIDCCLFACDCIEAMTGVDPAAPYFRSDGVAKYATKWAADQLIVNFAGSGATVENVAEIICDKLGFFEIESQVVRRGDLALLEGELGLTLGIHYGGSVLAPGPDGVVGLPAYLARRHWAV